MRVSLCLASLGTILVLVSGAAVAQRPFGFFAGGSALLGQESVRKELKLSEEQTKKVEELSAKMREQFKEAFGLEDEERRKKFQELSKENDKAVADILNREQAKRLGQISYQLRGAAAFNDEEVAKALALTDAQKEEIQKINEDWFAQAREVKGGPSDEARKKREDLSKAASEKIVTLLTDEQKAKWKDLQGEPFKGEIAFGPRGGAKKKQ